VPRSAFFLLRPDGHIGLCGRAVDAAAVRRYFSENLAWRDVESHRRIAGSNRPTAPVASVVEGGAC
jgi:predicted aminopeptidase